MPVVGGLGQDAAAAALQAAGLALGTITPQNDPALAGGHRDLRRSAGRAPRSPSARPVNLVVASGRVTINDVTGYTVDAATRELEGHGPRRSRRRRTRRVAAATPPTVASQSLAPGDVPIHSDDHADLLLRHLSRAP